MLTVAQCRRIAELLERSGRPDVKQLIDALNFQAMTIEGVPGGVSLFGQHWEVG